MDEKMFYVTEVGNFGSLDIDDPTESEIDLKKKRKKTHTNDNEFINEYDKEC